MSYQQVAACGNGKRIPGTGRSNHERMTVRVLVLGMTKFSTCTISVAVLFL